MEEQQDLEEEQETPGAEGDKSGAAHSDEEGQMHLVVVPDNGKAMIYQYRTPALWAADLTKYRRYQKSGELRASICTFIGQVCEIADERQSIRVKLPGSSKWSKIVEDKKPVGIIEVCRIGYGDELADGDANQPEQVAPEGTAPDVERIDDETAK